MEFDWSLQGKNSVFPFHFCKFLWINLSWNYHENVPTNDFTYEDFLPSFNSYYSLKPKHKLDDALIHDDADQTINIVEILFLAVKRKI